MSVKESKKILNVSFWTTFSERGPYGLPGFDGECMRNKYPRKLILLRQIINNQVFRKITISKYLTKKVPINLHRLNKVIAFSLPAEQHNYFRNKIQYLQVSTILYQQFPKASRILQRVNNLMHCM